MHLATLTAVQLRQLSVEVLDLERRWRPAFTRGSVVKEEKVETADFRGMPKSTSNQSLRFPLDQQVQRFSG